MAQLVTLMIASRGSSICGSGTDSQRISSFPCQRRAFITFSHQRRGGPAGCRPSDAREDFLPVLAFPQGIKIPPSGAFRPRSKMGREAANKLGQGRLQNPEGGVFHIEPLRIALALL